MIRFARLCAVLAVLFVSCTSGDGDQVVLDPENGTASSPTTTAPSLAGTEPAPEFPDGLDWLNVERPLSLAELRGKVVLLDFWTYGCINCIHIIPDLERLEAEYPEELVVIGVHSAKFENEGQTENIRQIVDRYGVEHPVVNDNEFRVWTQWGVNAWPTTILIDPAGNVVGGHSGEGVYAVVQPAVDRLVEEFAGQLDRSPIEYDRPTPPATVLSFPGKVLADADGGRLFVADTNHHRIVIADLATGEVTAVIGSGAQGHTEGPFDSATFDQPQGMDLSADGSTLYVADVGNHAVRSVDLVGHTVTTLVGTGRQADIYPPEPGMAPNVALSSPWDVLLEGDKLYIAMAGSHQIWSLDLGSGRAEPFVGNGREGVANGDRLDAELAQPSGLASNGSGRIFFADSESSSIRWADAGSGDQAGLLAGASFGLFDFGLEDGVGDAARFQHPLGVAYRDGNVYVADTYNSAIRRIDAKTGRTSTLAGGAQGWADGPEPMFYEPGGIDLAGGSLFVADTNNHAIRLIDLATGNTTTLVLFGIEEFRAPVQGMEAIVLDPIEVASGEVTVSIDVALPAGYVVNDLAPFTAEVTVDGIADSVSTVAPEFPVEVPVDALAGADAITVEMTTYYCEAEAKELCLIDQASYEIPVTVTSGGTTLVEVSHTIALPG